MPKVRVTALVMFTLQIKESLELKRSKSGDSRRRNETLHNLLRPVAIPLAARKIIRQNSFLRQLIPARSSPIPARNHFPCGPQGMCNLRRRTVNHRHSLRPATNSLRSATKSVQGPI